MLQIADKYVDQVDTAPFTLQLTTADGTAVPSKAVKSARWTGGSNSGDDITLGSTVAAQLKVELDRAKLGGIDVSTARLTAALVLQGKDDSLMIPWGELQVTEDNSDDDSVNITAGDAMLWAFSTPYALDDAALGFDWEAGVDGETLLLAICDACGVTLRTTGLREITLANVSPSGYTYREVIAFLACMWGCFARMDGEGQLVLQWYTQNDRPITAGRYYDGGLVKADYGYTVGYIKCYVETLEETLVVGDATKAQGIYIKCPWMSMECLQAVWTTVGGFSYRPVSELRFLGDPRLEPGDVLQVTDRDGAVYSVPCMTLCHEFDGGLITELSAVGKSSSASDKDYQGPVTRQIERAVKGIKASLIKYQDRIEQRVESVEGDVSEMIHTVDSIKMEVSQTTTADGKVYSSIELTVGGNTYTGMILMEGNLNVSGQLSADALYAAKGDIADLAVDKLSTSRRIVKYLAGDTSDDNYIRAEDETLAFVSGVYNDGTEQAKTPDGLPLYWEQDISDATLGTDGYPYVGGVRVFTTTGETAWPTMVYIYKELVKAQMAFEPYENTYLPVLTMGAGDGAGGDQMTIAKRYQKGEVLYKAKGGKEIGMTMSYDGYTDIVGQRRTQSIQINKSAGKVTVLAEGETAAQEITYTETDNSMTFTWPDGHTATVTIS